MTLRVSFELEAVSSIRMGKLLMDHLNDNGFLAKVNSLIGTTGPVAPPVFTEAVEQIVQDEQTFTADEARAAEAALITEATTKAARKRRTAAEIAADNAKAAAEKAAATVAATVSATVAVETQEVANPEADAAEQATTAPETNEADLMAALLGETAPTVTETAASANPAEKYAGLDIAALRVEVANRTRSAGHGIPWMKKHIEEAMKTNKKHDTVGKFEEKQLVAMLVDSDAMAAA